MSSIARPPARLSASATLKLPRWSLLIFCLLYILPGLIGRDPWKSEDASGFGIIWTMASSATHGGLSDWLLPNIVGAPMFDDGPLLFWISALCIKSLSILGDPVLAARCANALFFLLSITALWQTTYQLGLRPLAQPLALAFGGHPEAHDYGRTLADGTVLILLGTVGLLMRMHESSSDVASFAMLCLVLYALARSLDHPRSGAIWFAIALIGLSLSAGVLATAIMLLLGMGLAHSHPQWLAARRAFWVITLPLSLVGMLAWPLLAWSLLAHADQYFQARLNYLLADLANIDGYKFIVHSKMLLWFAWPSWPLALWAVWSWRRRLRSAHIALPLGFLCSALVIVSTTSETSEGTLLPLLPPLIILAAFALPTLKRGAANAIDWFSLMIYSSVAFLIWLGWLAMIYGYPAQIAANIAKQTPGFTAEFNWITFVVALLASLAWLAIVYWRAATHPKVLWRSMVLSGGGVILSWLLLMTLWLPALNYSKTYHDVALSLGQALPAKYPCVQTENLSSAQRASFAYFAQVRFTTIDYQGKQARCPYLLAQSTQAILTPRGKKDSRWRLIWQGRRAADRNENFYLFERVAREASIAQVQ